MAKKATSIDIKDIIVSASIGYTFGTNLFITGLPETPNNCIAIRDTGGDEPYQEFNWNRSIQILIRNTNYSNGWDKAVELMELLHDRTNETVNDSRYILIKAISDILHIGKDESKTRDLFSINFNVEVSQ